MRYQKLFLRGAKIVIFAILAWSFGLFVADVGHVKAQDAVDQPTAPVGTYVEESGELDFPCEEYEIVDANVDNPVVQRGELKIYNIEPAMVCVMPSSLDIGWSHGSLVLEHPQAMYRSKLRVIDGSQVIGEVLIYQGIGTYRIVIPVVNTYISYRDNNHAPNYSSIGLTMVLTKARSGTAPILQSSTVSPGLWQQVTHC